MLRRLRHKLAMIRYYSAPRRRTAWTRALDIALVVSFLLCLPATWIANAAVISSRTAVDLSGLLAQPTEGSSSSAGLTASLMNSGRGRAPGAETKITGNFRLTVQEHYRGWPLTTSIHRQPAQLDLDILAEKQARTNVRLDRDSAIRLAIEQALIESEQFDALDTWRSETVRVRMHWLNWFIAAGIWWILMVFTSSFVIQFARFFWMMGERRLALKRAQRRGEGKCASCGYDLTGLDFNERCPECGSLVG